MNIFLAILLAGFDEAGDDEEPEEEVATKGSMKSSKVAPQEKYEMKVDNEDEAAPKNDGGAEGGEAKKARKIGHKKLQLLQ